MVNITISQASNKKHEGSMTDSDQSIRRPTNNLVTPLLTDLYQITMGYGYWKSGRHKEHAVFELFFRVNPFKGAYTIFAGVDEALSFIHHFKFTKEDIDYLKETPALCNCEDEFFEYLANLDCSEVCVKSVQQGTIVFPREPLMIVSGPILICQLLETILLNLVNFPSLVATNAARLVIAARGQFGTVKVNNQTPKCIEFGLRRAQGPDGGLSASKYCIVGGFDGTANVQAGKLFGLPISGTHAHAFVQSHCDLEDVNHLTLTNKNGGKVQLLPLVLEKRMKLGQSFGEGWLNTNKGELAAFVAYAAAFPHGFLSLVDTYDTIHSGIKNFIMVSLVLNDCGYSPIGIRLDSGDLGALSLQCREIFNDISEKLECPFFRDLTIVASDSINEKKLLSLNKNGHSITAFGIGTHLVTCQAQPALGCVFKLVELNGKARIKFSEDPIKTLIPGEKRVFRLYDESGSPQMDYMTRIDDNVPQVGIETTCFQPFKKDPVKITPSKVDELLIPIWDRSNGAKSRIIGLMEARESVISQIKHLDSGLLNDENTIEYKVYLSQKLHQHLDEVQDELRVRG